MLSLFSTQNFTSNDQQVVITWINKLSLEYLDINHYHYTAMTERDPSSIYLLPNVLNHKTKEHKFVNPEYEKHHETNTAPRTNIHLIELKIRKNKHRRNPHE